MKRIIFQVFIAIYGISAWSQTTDLDSLLNDVVWSDRKMMRLIDPPSSFCYLYGGVASDQKTMYAGRELGEDMRSFNGNIYFFHDKGMFIGASGLLYGSPGQEYNTVIASAGINRNLNPQRTLYFRAIYSRFFHMAQDTGLTDPFSNSFGTGLTLRNKWMGGRVSANFLFGKEFGVNITPSLFFRLPLVKFGLYNKIQTEPDISVFFGSETVELETISGQQSGPQITYSLENSYGVLNTQVYLPICLYLGDLDFEMGYYLNIPFTSQDKADYPTTSYFSISLGYMIPLN